MAIGFFASLPFGIQAFAYGAYVALAIYEHEQAIYHPSIRCADGEIAKIAGQECASGIANGDVEIQNLIATGKNQGLYEILIGLRGGIEVRVVPLCKAIGRNEEEQAKAKQGK